MMRRMWWAAFWAVCFFAAPAQAEAQSLFSQGDGARQATAAPASLFVGAQTGMFRPIAPRVVVAAPAPMATQISPRLNGSTRIDRLLTLIAQAEAGSAGYDAVQYGARIRPGKRPTDMTLGEIYAWIAATPGQPHAIGRYQFIPPTLRRVARLRGYGPDVRFTPDIQDSLALILLEDAGLRDFENGTLQRRTFMRNLARIWAGLPLPNGRSYYEGYAGNSAAMTWSVFYGGIADIWGST